MSRPPRWRKSVSADGVMEVALTHWKYFHDFCLQEVPTYQTFVWRGQRDADWSLESSLDRLLGAKGSVLKNSRSRLHLERFKLAVRGRRGPNPPKIKDESEWWALGQHQGLATPLLDWTESPYVALYFAFEKAQRPTNGKRAVWGLANVATKNKQIEEAHAARVPAPTMPPPTLDIVRPYQDENARLVSQAGLFTKVPLGETVDKWVKTQYVGQKGGPVLLKISIPNAERTDCLKSLNRMNINALSLFPDVYGAARHCNMGQDIVGY